MSDSNSSTLTYVLGILSAVYILNSFSRSETYKLWNIPTIGGPSWPILSFYGTFNMLIRGPTLLQEAERKFKGGTYKYATISGWVVVVTKPQLINEIGKAPTEVMSMVEITKRSLQTYHTLGRPIADNEYHHIPVRSLLTHNLDLLFPDIHDEVVASFNKHISPREDEWMAVPVSRTLVSIVSNITNRVIVGLPLCRVAEYCELMQKFTFQVIKASTIINFMPVMIQPYVGPLVSTLNASIDQSSKFTAPIIQERLKMREQYGDDWTDKPVDVLQSLIQYAPEEELNVRDLTMRILTLNFAAIHTSSTSFTTTLYYLASNPAEYLHPLQEEVDSIIAEYGWCKTALQKMRKLDSFLKESLRCVSLGAVASARFAMKDFTMSDGTTLPAGTTVCVALQTIHHDDTIYSDAATFKPWRFSDMREEDGEGIRHQAVSITKEYLSFGYGRHACPGRFFAVNELKTMLAHIVTTYDVKLENEGVVPPITKLGMTFIPDRNARVMFRKRQPRGAQ